jgi:hypothetical protein
MNELEPDHKHNNWIVGMLDILGQQKVMEDLDFVNSQMSQPDVEKFNKGVAAVYHATQLLHESVNAWIDMSIKASISAAGAAASSLTAPDITPSHKLKWQRFSDGVVVYTSLADCPVHDPFRSLYFLIGGCAYAMLSMLANGTPIRGGIALGAGCEFQDSELYGPVLARAHYLESEIAGYPRIVVEQRVHRFLLAGIHDSDGGKRTEADRTLPRLCLEMLHPDVDGNMIVDFLSPVIFKQLGIPCDRNMIGGAMAFANSQYDEHRKNRCSKLAFRYANLLTYMDWRERQNHGES